MKALEHDAKSHVQTLQPVSGSVITCFYISAMVRKLAHLLSCRLWAGHELESMTASLLRIMIVSNVAKQTTTETREKRWRGCRMWRVQYSLIWAPYCLLGCRGGRVFVLHRRLLICVVLIRIALWNWWPVHNLEAFWGNPSVLPHHALFIYRAKDASAAITGCSVVLVVSILDSFAQGRSIDI